MGGMVAAFMGLPIAIFGLLVMRDPMRLSIFAPGEKGYYQRAFFDVHSRNLLRAFGMLISLFGASIVTDGLGVIFKALPLQAVSKGLWALMGLTFVVLWCVGVGCAIMRAIQGKSLGWSEWFELRRRGIELGPIDVFPSITPKMRKEALAFTVGFLILVFIAAGIALIR